MLIRPGSPRTTCPPPTTWRSSFRPPRYIREAGRCMVMLTTIASKPFVIVLLDSWGKYTRLGDAQRVKHWLETGETLASPMLGLPRRFHGSIEPRPRHAAKSVASARVVRGGVHTVKLSRKTRVASRAPARRG